MTLGYKIKSRREELGLTQPELAEKTLLSQGYISRVERGTLSPTAPAVAAFAKALSISADELLGINDEKRAC